MKLTPSPRASPFTLTARGNYAFAIVYWVIAQFLGLLICQQDYKKEVTGRLTNYGWVGHDPETCVSDSGGELIHSETKDLIERLPLHCVIENGKK